MPRPSALEAADRHRQLDALQRRRQELSALAREYVAAGTWLADQIEELGRAISDMQDRAAAAPEANSSVAFRRHAPVKESNGQGRRVVKKGAEPAD